MATEDSGLKACPFCGKQPERIDDMRCWCTNRDCIMQYYDVFVDDWNNRALPDGAVMGWVRKVKGKPLRFESIYTISRVPIDLEKECTQCEEVIPVAIIPLEERP